MTDPLPREAQTSDDIPLGPLSEDNLRQQWNAQADEHNQWESLDSAEQLAWAQARAIAADRRARAALKPEPVGEGLSSDRGYEAGAMWTGHPVRPATPPTPGPPAEALAARPLLEQVARLGRLGLPALGEIVTISNRAAAWLRDNPPGQPVKIEPRGCPTPGACSCVMPAPPVPVPEEVGELVETLTQEAGSLEAHCNKIVNGECRTLACLQRGGYTRSDGPPNPSVATCPDLEKAGAKRRAITLLQQQSAELAALREERFVAGQNRINQLWVDALDPSTQVPLSAPQIKKLRKVLDDYCDQGPPNGTMWKSQEMEELMWAVEGWVSAATPLPAPQTGEVQS